jgi:hypothetical protein
MMAGRLLEEPWPVQHGTTLGILGREYEAGDPGEAYGAGTHGARFERNIKYGS